MEYRHGLKSWVMYQHVEHLVSLTRLIALCEEFFPHAPSHELRVHDEGHNGRALSPDL